VQVDIAVLVGSHEESSRTALSMVATVRSKDVEVLQHLSIDRNKDGDQLPSRKNSAQCKRSL